MSKLQASTIWALVAGFFLTLAGTITVVLGNSEMVLIVAACMTVAGVLLFAFGAIELARAKGYTGGWAAVGLVGLLGVIGLVALLLLPDRETAVLVHTPIPGAAHWSTLSGASASAALDRCPACGRLVPRDQPCPECEAKRLAPRSHAWDLRIAGAILVALVALGINLSAGLALALPAVAEVRAGQADVAAEDAAAKSLVRNAMTAMESAYIDTYTFAITPDYLTTIEPSINFRWASDHVVTVGGVPAAKTSARANDSAVDYFGDEGSYSVSTISESGDFWGVFVDKVQGYGNVYVRGHDHVTTQGW